VKISSVWTLSPYFTIWSVALLKVILARPSIQNRGCLGFRKTSLDMSEHVWNWISVKISSVWTLSPYFTICFLIHLIIFPYFSTIIFDFFCVIFQTKQTTEKETLECWKYKQEHRPRVLDARLCIYHPLSLNGYGYFINAVKRQRNLGLMHLVQEKIIPLWLYLSILQTYLFIL
jgi:hypothetical protein